jgi:flagellar basal-body rod modification protein FlgD
MDLSGIFATSDEQSTTLPQNTQLDKDAFMQLLVQQIRNQDPLEPVTNEDFIAQLASFSSLEEMEQLNDNVVSMVLLQQSNALLQQLTDSSALIGRTITWEESDGGALKSGVVQSVKIDGGIALLKVDGEDVPLPYVIQVDGPPTGSSATNES